LLIWSKLLIWSRELSNRGHTPDVTTNPACNTIHTQDKTNSDQSI
jgi:hypothetical protein